jgi:REP element-mobilizing transposase RayT
MQLALDLRRRTWGGARDGAGRPGSKDRRDPAHRARPVHDPRHPVHVVLRTRREVGRLRRGEVYRAIRRALIRISTRVDFRVVQLSIQHNHLHLLVEAAHAEALSRGMQALAITAAKAINGSLGRTGKVFAYRYHATPITSPRQAYRALGYVANNWRRHREDVSAPGLIDPYSSARALAGWTHLAPEPDDPLPVSAPRTWLLSTGWTLHGPLDPRATPGSLE